MTTAFARQPKTSDPAPILVREIELSEPVAAIPAGAGPSGLSHASARVLVRLHGEPLGSLDLSLEAGEIAPEKLLMHVLTELREPLTRHLSLDGLELPAELPLSGLAGAAECRSEPKLPAEPGLVTVVVATMGSPDLLSRCLDSVLANDHPNFELLVVDTRPIEAVIEPLLKKLYSDDPRVRYVMEPQPGLSHARNTGLLFARGDVVVFLDDDVTVDKQWLRALASEFESDPTVACVTGLLRAAELETGPQIYFDSHTSLNADFTRRVLSISPDDETSPFPAEGLPIGAVAGMGLRRSLLGDLWAFDVSLGTGSFSRGGEEFDSLLELLFAGHRIVFQPRMLAWHWYDESYEDLLEELRSYGMGLGAVMTKQLLTSRRGRLRVLRRAPGGLRQAFGVEQPARLANGAEYPRDLARQELIGLVNGPFAYIHSRLRQAWLSA